MIQDSDLKLMGEGDRRPSRSTINALVRGMRRLLNMSGDGRTTVNMSQSGIAIGGPQPSGTGVALQVEFVKIVGYGTGLWNRSQSSFKARRMDASRNATGPVLDVYARSYHPDTPSVACGIQDLALCTPGYTTGHEIAVATMTYRSVTSLWAIDCFLLTCAGAART